MQKNISLWIGLAIPVLMIVFVAAAIYLPRYFVEPPQYDFVYLVGNNYIGDYYEVRNGVLTKISQPLPAGVVPAPRPEPSPRFFVYHVGDDSSQELTFETVSQ